MNSTPPLPISDMVDENYIRIKNNNNDYFISIKILENIINISLFQDYNCNLFFENSFSLDYLKEQHKYLSLSENINEAFGILNQYLINSFFKENDLEKTNEIKLIIPIIFFGKTKEICLNLIKNKGKFKLSSILKNYEQRISLLENKISNLELRISRLEQEKKNKGIIEEDKDTKINSIAFPIREKVENLIQENEVLNPFNYVFDIYILKNGNIIIAGNGLVIYNPTNLSEIQRIQYRNHVLCVFELRNGDLITSSYDGTIKIIKLSEDNKSYEFIQEMKGREDSQYFRKLIELLNGYIVSCDSKHILVWKKNNSNNKYEIHKDFNLQTHTYCILELNKDYFVTILAQNQLLQFYSSNELRKVKELNGIKTINTYDWNVLKLLNEETFVVGGNGFIYLISISKMTVIYILALPNNEIIYSLITLPNNSILVGASYNSKHGLIQYKINKDGSQIIEYSRNINNIHTNLICSLEKIIVNGKWKILTGSYDYKLKIWS